MSEDSTGKKETTRGKSPDFLEPGQNFYDQSPFSTVAIVLQRNHDIPLEAVRIAFTKIAQAKQVMSRDATPEHIERWKERLIERIFIETEERKRKHLNVDRAVLKECVDEAIDLLNRFPFWDEYVWSQRGGYGIDGDLTSGQMKILPDTYKQWAGGKIKRQNVLRYAGIERAMEETPHGPSRRVIRDTNRLSKRGRHY